MSAATTESSAPTLKDATKWEEDLKKIESDIESLREKEKDLQTKLDMFYRSKGYMPISEVYEQKKRKPSNGTRASKPKMSDDALLTAVKEKVKNAKSLTPEKLAEAMKKEGLDGRAARRVKKLLEAAS